MTADIDHLWEEWEENQRRQLALSLEDFLANSEERFSPDAIVEFRRQVRKLDVLDRKINALQDEKTTANARADVAPTDELSERAHLKAESEPIAGYRLIVRLGEGGFGEVWKAAGPGGVFVALKFIRLVEEAAQIEERSLDLSKQIRHPHVLSISGIWRQGRYLIIASELADQTLLDRYKEARRAGNEGIPGDELLEYMVEAAEALDFLNYPIDGSRPRMQHRDIKPENIFLCGGRIKVGDLGLVRAMNRSETGHTGHMTAAYAAPEFINGQTSDYSDQYSLAVTYCMLRGGRLPFEGSPATILNGHLHGKPDLSMIPSEERKVVSRALSKKPKKRWPSCRAFVSALKGDRITSGALPRASKPGRTSFSFVTKLKKRFSSIVSVTSRHRNGIIAVLCLLAILIVVLFLAYDSKLHALNKRIQENPEDHDAYAERAKYYLEKGNWKEAVDDATHAIELDPQDASYWIIRGKSYLRGNRPEIALTDFDEAIHIAPKNSGGFLMRAQTHQRLRRYAEALEDVNQAIHLKPDEASLLLQRGKILQSLRRWDDALADFNDVLRINPNDPEPKALRAGVLAAKGHKIQAMQEALEVVDDYPKFAFGHRVLGIMYSIRGETGKAIASYSEAIRLNPEDADAIALRGDSYLNQGDLSKALDDLNVALELNPLDEFALKARGRLYYQRRNYAEAREDFTSAIQLEPNSSYLYLRRGECCLALKVFDAAIKDATAALERDENNALALGVRAIAHGRSGNPEQAIQDATAAIKLKPTEYRFFQTRAAAYQDLGRDEECNADWERAMRLKEKQE